MTERLTSIHLPNSQGTGIMEWGDQTKEYMLQRVREHSRYLRSKADEIDAAADGEFHIVSALGVHVRRNPRIIQQSSRLPEDVK